MPEMIQDDDSFECLVTTQPTKSGAGGPIFLTAAEAANMAADAGCKTKPAFLSSIVKTRVQVACNEGLFELRRPFDGLIREASEATKRAVLADLEATDDYRVTAGGNLDDAVIAWGLAE